MSRVGKKPVDRSPRASTSRSVPRAVDVKGPKGSVTAPILAGITVEKKDGTVVLVRKGEEKQDKALHGLNRALLQNAVLGVTVGLQARDRPRRIGYKAEVKGKNVVFNVGYSHQVTFPMPEGVSVERRAGREGQGRHAHRRDGRRQAEGRPDGDQIRGITSAGPVQAQGLPLRRRDPQEEGRQGDGQVRN